MALDRVQRRRERVSVRVRVQRVLLRVQDEDDWVFPDVLLFRVHRDVLPRPRARVRRDRVRRRERVRAADIPKHQVRLIGERGGCKRASAFNQSLYRFASSSSFSSSSFSLVKRDASSFSSSSRSTLPGVDPPLPREVPAAAAAAAAFASAPATPPSASFSPSLPPLIPNALNRCQSQPTIAAPAYPDASSKSVPNASSRVTASCTNARVSSYPGDASARRCASAAAYNAPTTARSPYQPPLVAASPTAPSDRW
mmetsp:Transcript_4754/g.16953  ORF Transcript_4754/g.16953 Transcript_4754/m.16953 type:complete len:254 (+) Transcript_4754:1714-2475(+)